MNVLNRIKNAVRGAKQRWGTAQTKRTLWNQEFASGRWDSIEKTPGDMIYPYVEKYCRGGSILDLGCGSGNTGCELAANSYQAYTGIDISDVALEKARARSARSQRNHKNRYAQADISAYVPDVKHDVILFRESLYYLPHKHLGGTLERYSHFLKPEGVLIIRWHESMPANDLPQLVGRSLQLVEQHLTLPSGPSVLIFRPLVQPSPVF